MEPSSNKPSGIGVKRINEMSIAYQQAGVLWAGIELELFTRISEGATKLGEIAKAVGAKPEAIDRLLAACFALGLVEEKDGSYSNAPDVERYLVKGKPTYHGDWALFHKGEYEQWKNLASVVRPPKDYYQRVREDPRAARQLTVSGYHSSISAGQKFARECDLSSFSLLLDLGGGSGVYSIMACRKYPNLRSIVFDVATVCAVADEFIAQAGLSERIKTHPGDYLVDRYPGGADAVLICGTLEPRSTEDHEIVLRKVFDTLPPGGKLFLIINMLDDDRKGPLEAVFSNLGNVVTTGPWGRIHSAADIARMLTAAGFVDLAFSDFVPGTYRRVLASKPR
jgi:O-methyltransferase domain/Dimerisation domain